MGYIIHYDVGALVLSLFSIFCIAIKKGNRRVQDRIFMFILGINSLAAIADIFSLYANAEPYSYSLAYLEFINVAYLLLHNMMPVAFVYYIYCYIGLNSKGNRTKDMLAIFLPWAVISMTLLINPLIKFVFYFDENRMYTHGFGIYLFYLLDIGYCLWTVIILAKYRKSISATKTTMVGIYIALAVGGSLVQLVRSDLIIELFCEAVAFLGIMFTFENYDEIVNPVTGAFNRRGVILDGAKYIDSRIPFTFFTVKMRDVAYLNATFGIEHVNELEKEMIAFFKIFGQTTVYNFAEGQFGVACFDRNNVDEIERSIKGRFNHEWNCGESKMVINVEVCRADYPEQLISLEGMLMMVDAPVDDEYKEDGVSEKKYEGYTRSIKVEKSVDKATENKSFEVYYQPIYNVKEQKIHAAEALLRLHDDELGWIRPDELIDLSERKGYIVDIGEFVLEEVCKFYTQNHLDKIGIDYININMSVVQCMNSDIVDRFKAIMEKYDMKPEHLRLEITESALARNKAALLNVINQFNNIGLEFAMDDFGSGYSNFSYALDYPFSVIKIDKSILWSSAEAGENGNSVIGGLVNMFHDMHKTVLVEGVETIEQKDLVENNHTDYIQGFYFSKPVPGEEFLKYCTDFKISA